MWIPAGAGKYHPALESDGICVYYGVRHNYNVFMTEETPLPGNYYVWYNGGKASSAVIINGQALYSSYGQYTDKE